MAAQHALRGFIEMTIQGVPLTQALAMEFNNVAYAATGPGGLVGAFKQMGGLIAPLLTPMRLLGVGVAATGAAAYFAYSSWKTFALQMDDVSRQADTTIKTMASLQAAASFKGIGSDDFIAGMQKFSAAIYEANSGSGSLATLLRANNVEAKTFEQALFAVADLIQRAGSEQEKLNLLQQAGLPATADMVRLFGGGAEALRVAQGQAVQFGDAVNQHMIESARRFDEAWNRFWTNFGREIKGAVVGVADFLGKVDALANKLIALGGIDVGRNLMKGGYGTQLGTNVEDFYKATNRFGASAGGTVDPNVLKRTIETEQQRLSILGQTATVEEQLKAVEDQLTLTRLNYTKLNITDTEQKNLERLARERALGTDAIKQSTDATLVEVQTFGMSAGAAAAYRVELERVMQARRMGQQLTPQDLKDIDAAAQAYGRVTAQLEHLKDAKEASSAISTDLANAFADVTLHARSFSEAMTDVAQSLYRYIVQAELAGAGPLAGVLGTKQSGGIFGSVLNPLLSGKTTTGTMNVQAASVIINGTVGGSGGITSAPLAPLVSSPGNAPSTQYYGSLADRIKAFEGYNSHAYPDYGHYSIGYGTYATSPTEVITQAQAQARLQAELAKASGVVNGINPNLDQGTKDALTSLTYNAGSKWTTSGLGDAVRAGDLDAIKAKLLEYNKAGGVFNPGLADRRSVEASWIGNPQIAQAQQKFTQATEQSAVNLDSLSAGATDSTSALSGFTAGLQNVFKSFGSVFPSGLTGGAPDFGASGGAGGGGSIPSGNSAIAPMAGAARGVAVNIHMEDHAGVAMTETRRERNGNQVDIWTMVQKRTSQDIGNKVHNKALTAATSRPPVPG
jgi:GH24 family phage-related lysozyme (muramidase)